MLREALADNPKTGMRSVKGGVTIDGKPAIIGQQVGPGQRVVTAGDGEAVFVIGDDAFLQRENSEFGMESGAGIVVLRYLTGKILSVFGTGAKQLITPTATIGIRGTGCYIEAEPDRTYFCLCYGGAVVQPNANPAMSKILRTRHHEQPLIISSSAAQDAMLPAGVINHTDAELVMLEALVGRKPPFDGQDRY
ncbi:hypothetical protein D3871_15800 [Noviherbaspirillum saxi]|uniref:FecR family protein n=2 Tax=Noviherbaspirillum saxi TaxID=2320863 RepID=A0A3A3GGY1_9BURK|nr:hypothetical protein D3871_15800 [Noviherbaspirillum saxi]